MVVFNDSRWLSTGGPGFREDVPEETSDVSRIGALETTPMVGGLFRPFWILAAAGAAVPVLALAIIALASSRSLNRFEAVHHHAEELSTLRKIEARVTRGAEAEGADRTTALQESKKALGEVLGRHLYLEPETGDHLRKASAMLAGEPLEGVRELEESLAGEVTAHDRLLVQVE